jgi:hypothetical protein
VAASVGQIPADEPKPDGIRCRQSKEILLSETRNFKN